MKLRICYTSDLKVISVTDLDTQREAISWVPHVADIVVRFEDAKFTIEIQRSTLTDVFLADLIQAYYDFLTKVKQHTGG